MSKIIVEGFGGEVYTAATHAAIVDKMRASSWGGDLADGPRGYMKQIAKRVYDWCGKEINTVKAEQFLSDLSKSGLIRMTNMTAGV